MQRSLVDVLRDAALTREALADVDGGRVVDHQAVRAWVDVELVAGMLNELAADWQLSAQERIDIVFLAISDPTLQRAGQLFTIHKRLSLLFADSELVKVWLKTSNRAFENRPPIEVMRSPDVTGLMSVLAYLDQIF